MVCLALFGFVLFVTLPTVPRTFLILAGLALVVRHENFEELRVIETSEARFNNLANFLWQTTRVDRCLSDMEAGMVSC